VQRRRVQQRADVPQRLAQAPVRLSADQCAALVGAVQAEDHAHGGRFPGAVGADEGGDPARRDGEGHPVQRDGRPVPLTQVGDLNFGFHARKR
jgi:hypothetical protein